MILDQHNTNEETLDVIDEEDEEEVLLEYEIATYPSDFTLVGILDAWRAGEINIPEFQREFVWTIKQASALIESFLLGLPVPSVFFYIDENNINLVIDGQQRILSIVSYLSGKFPPENRKNEQFSVPKKTQIFRLKGLNKKSPFYEKSFEELDVRWQRKLKTSCVLRAMNVRQLRPNHNNTSIYHIFERLNTGGTPLQPQEIRNCVFRGEIINELRELNTDQNWRILMGKKGSDKHQKDIELVLRMFALSELSGLTYESPMKEFLNLAQKNTHIESKSWKKFKEKFPQTAQFIADQFGDKPFHRRGPLNASILDSVFCTILNHIDHLPDNIKARYESLNQSDKFIELTTMGTSSTATLTQRFELAKQYLID